MTLIDRLGFDADTKALIIHADDSGMCHGANVATRDALNSGAVNSTAVMVPCPWFSEFAEMCREHPEWDVGVHLTHTSEWRHYRWGPVLPTSSAPGLIDSEGYLHRDSRSAAENATPDEIDRESRAQIDRAMEFGIRPTHIDTHMGVMGYRREFAEVYLRLGQDYGLPVKVRAPVSEFHRERIGDDIADRVESGELPAVQTPSVRVESVGLEARTLEYQEMLRSLKPGVTELIVHLGTDDEEMKAMMNAAEERVNDHLAFADPSTRRLIEDEGIRLVQWRDIGKATC